MADAPNRNALKTAKTDIDITREELVNALQWAWNDFVGDTGHFPDCFERRGGKLYANFGRGNFASMVLDVLKHARTVPGCEAPNI